MMKFLFPCLFFCGLFFMNNLFFYAGLSLFVFLGLVISLNMLTLTSGIYLGLSFFVDILSMGLIMLSIWISILMYYSSTSILSSKSGQVIFALSVLILFLTLMVTFSSFNLLVFYFFFEISLIPTLFIIMGWGYQPERLQAGIYFLFYTLTASLPLLFLLVLYSYNSGSLDFFIWGGLESHLWGWLVFLGFTMAFLVKMPMFFTHLWLPKAHVEAPVAGSMILAGVLLKLGGYGFYRILPICLGGLLEYGIYIFGLSLVGMIYVGLICCRLNDLKALVAYSSVAHMALVICGVYSMFFWGYLGGLVMMIAHGLASSGLFCIVNMYYERSGSRSMYMNQGLILLFPVFSLFIFLLSAANMAAPPTLNLMSEIFLMASLLKFDKIMLLVFPLGSYLGAVFTLFLFSFSQHGKSYEGFYSFLVPSFREYHVLFLHIFPVNFLIIKPEYYLGLN